MVHIKKPKKKKKKDVWHWSSDHCLLWPSSVTQKPLSACPAVIAESASCQFLPQGEGISLGKAGHQHLSPCAQPQLPVAEALSRPLET